MELLWIYVVLGIIVVAFCVCISAQNKKAENEFISAARRIRAGMSLNDVLSIMGNDYTYSALKNGVEKYEWRLRKNGYSYRVAKGVSMRQSGYTRRISVKFKDGVVIETSAINMD